jgi:predicted phosphoribosyltransferase
MPFRDRAEAGQKLGDKLRAYAGRPDVLVLALPRGGIPVACEVAKALEAPLDVLVVARLVAPHDDGVTIGAVAGGGVRVIDRDLCRALCITDEAVDRLVERERAEIERRDRVYHECVPRLDLRGKTVILVDDGMATGASMRAAVSTARQSGPAALVVAVALASTATCAELGSRVDDVVYCYCRDPIYAVRLWFESYPKLSEEEACRLLREASAGGARARAANA